MGEVVNGKGEPMPVPLNAAGQPPPAGVVLARRLLQSPEGKGKGTLAGSSNGRMTELMSPTMTAVMNATNGKVRATAPAALVLDASGKSYSATAHATTLQSL